MEVYLVPIGRGGHALYCEPGDEPHRVEPPAANRGVWRRLTDKFGAVLDAVEREQVERAKAGRHAPPPPAGFIARFRARAMAWVAEKVAEQRLLWRLRGRGKVIAHVPAGLDRERAMATIRGNLAADFNRHRWWMVVDGLGGLLSLALVPVPGPNMLGYYFAFRIVGHFLSLQGARHGLNEVRWELEDNQPLSELVGIDELADDERERRVESVALQLGLPRFPHFYRRAAVRLRAA